MRGTDKNSPLSAETFLYTNKEQFSVFQLLLEMVRETEQKGSSFSKLFAHIEGATFESSEIQIVVTVFNDSLRQKRSNLFNIVMPDRWKDHDWTTDVWHTMLSKQGLVCKNHPTPLCYDCVMREPTCVEFANIARGNNLLRSCLCDCVSTFIEETSCMCFDVLPED